MSTRTSVGDEYSQLRPPRKMRLIKGDGLNTRRVGLAGKATPSLVSNVKTVQLRTCRFCACLRSAHSHKHRHATHLAQFQSDFHIRGQKSVFYGTSVRVVTLNDFLERIGDSQKARWESLG